MARSITIRRVALAKEVSLEIATEAHEDLLALPIELVPYPRLAGRV